MSYQINGVIRDYNSASDTCTVEIVSGGVIDTWIDGCRIHNAIPRAQVAYGINCILTMPDQHRICEAVVTTVFPPNSTAQANATGILLTQNGRLAAASFGNTALTFPVAFTVAPTVTATADRGTVAISAITTTGCTFGISGSGRDPNAIVYITWTAVGN